MLKKIFKVHALNIFDIIYQKNKKFAILYLILLLKIRKQVRLLSYSAILSEPKVIKNYFSDLKQNSGVLLDVGASIGSFFEYFLNKQTNWRIYAFEPDPNPMKQEALKYFSKNNNVSVIRQACSDSSGEKLQFFTSPLSMGISSLHSFDSTHSFKCFVETITLSDFIIESKLKFVDILKIDTEGHDLFVLQGFPWSAIKPKVIMCEFENKKTSPLGYTYEDLGDYLLQKGYNVFVSEWYPVIEYGPINQWRALKKFPTKLEDDNASGNFICFDENIYIDNFFTTLVCNTKLH